MRFDFKALIIDGSRSDKGVHAESDCRHALPASSAAQRGGTPGYRKDIVFGLLPAGAFC
jgi:hypothetical protein